MLNFEKKVIEHRECNSVEIKALSEEGLILLIHEDSKICELWLDVALTLPYLDEGTIKILEDLKLI